jgi:hypothetical protein
LRPGAELGEELKAGAKALTPFSNRVALTRVSFGGVMQLFAQVLLALALGAMFLHALYAIVQGRVYCKGSWYTRGESGWFWPVVLMYLLGAPYIGLLAFKAAWK